MSLIILWHKSFFQVRVDVQLVTDRYVHDVLRRTVQFIAACHTGGVCFVNLFRSILPVVPTACDVLIVCRQHNDKECKFKEQHAKMWENIAGAKRYYRPRGFSIAGASAAAVPTPLDRTTKHVVHVTICH